jgi:hypothetical protein
MGRNAKDRVAKRVSDRVRAGWIGGGAEKLAQKQVLAIPSAVHGHGRTGSHRALA